MTALGTVSVPNKPAYELIDAIEAKYPNLKLHPTIRDWDFFRDAYGREIPGRGQNFEYAMFEGGRWPKPKEWCADFLYASVYCVALYFDGSGFAGHAAAFYAWILQAYEIRPLCYATVPNGRHLLIPKVTDPQSLDPTWKKSGVPCLYLNQRQRQELGYYTSDRDRGTIWKFLGFKPLC
jgi:hypothetical protein